LTTKLRDSQRGTSDAGGVIGIILVLAVLVWIAAVLILPHMNMTNQEALGHRDAMYQIAREMELHQTDAETILEPRFDGSLDTFVNRKNFENVPYPDRDEVAAAISDMWCRQVSPGLLPTVHFRDVQTGSTLVTRGCVSQSSPDITGNYSGTVHNNTVNVDSTFEVQLIKTTNGVRGCMQVAMPLIGTGPVSGTLNDRNLVVDLAAPDVRIRFDGTRVGHSITGQYTVTTNRQTGTFTLHQDIPRVKIGFDPNNCPR
jgi:hypothetical protein